MAKIKNQKGVILLLTLFILMGILAVTLSAGSLVFAGIIMNRLTGYSSLAFFASEAGMERALWESRKNGYSLPGQNQNGIFTNPDIGNASAYTVNYATSTPFITFKSIGNYHGVKRSVEGTYSSGGAGACVPNCSGKVCGSDGCGGSCGSCGANQSCVAGACVENPAAPSQIAYTAPGTYQWTVPSGVTSVSVVCIGAGGGPQGVGGGGGGLGWKNNITVVPGNQYAVVVGAGGNGANNGGDSYFINISTVKGAGGGRGISAFGSTGGTYVGDGGGSGGGSDNNAGEGAIYTGGGGTGGYTGSGGHGRVSAGSSALADSGGAGGGGGTIDIDKAGGGGGTGIYGKGMTGAGGGERMGGEGGSGGGTGGSGSTTCNGGLYGGGAGDCGVGGGGACRIIWPGNLRQFPSTRTANE